MSYSQVVAASASNLSVASPGITTLDGVSLSVGSRILLTAQSTASQNGVWVFQGSGSALTRPAAPDQYSSTNTLDNATVVWVTGGNARGGSVWVLDPAGKVTVDTTAFTLTRAALPPVQARAASTFNLASLSSVTSLDGVSLVGNGAAGSDILLLKDQSTASGNGLYWANTTGAMVRANEPLVSGRSVVVTEGISNGQTQWNLGTSGVISLGATSLAFLKLLPAGSASSVRLVATANLTLSGEQTIDGVLTSASRVLLTGQTSSAQNGIWVTSSGPWARPADFSVDAQVVPGQLVFVQVGSTNAGVTWQLLSGLTMAAAKVYAHFQKSAVIDLAAPPWNFLANSSDETTTLDALLAFTKAQLALGIPVAWRLNGMIGMNKTFVPPQGLSIYGQGLSSGFRLLEQNQARQHAFSNETTAVLNSGGGLYGTFSNFTVQNDQCMWSYGGQQPWVGLHPYVPADEGSYFHTPIPGMCMLKLITAGKAGANPPIGTLNPLGLGMKCVGTETIAHATLVRVSQAGFFGPGGAKFDFSIDGGATWSVTGQATVNYPNNVFLLSAVGSDFGVMIGDNSYSVSPTTTTTAGFTQPAVGSTVTLTLAATAGISPYFTQLAIPGAGLYIATAILSGTQITAQLLISFASGSIASGLTVQQCFAPHPRVEVLGTPGANAIAEFEVTNGVLGQMQYNPKYQTTYDKWVYTTAGFSGLVTSGGSGATHFDDTTTIPGCTIRFHAGVYYNNSDIHYQSAAPGFSTEAGGVTNTGAAYAGEQITDGACLWQVVTAPDAIRIISGAGGHFDSVSTNGGNCGYALCQVENIEVVGNYQCNAHSLACIWISNGDMYFGEGGQFSNAIHIGGTANFFSTGYGIIDDGGLGHTFDGMLGFGFCATGWIQFAGIYGGSLEGYYIETAGGKFRNASYNKRYGGIQGVTQFSIGSGYGASIAGNYMLDTYGATYDAHAILGGGGVSVFGNVATCAANISGYSINGVPLVDAFPNHGQVIDERSGNQTWAGRETYPFFEQGFSNGNNNDFSNIVRTDIAIVGPTAAFATTGFLAPAASFALGARLRLRNYSAQWWTVPNQSSGSLAANRIYTPTGSDVLIPPNIFSWAELEYVTYGTPGWYLMNTSSTVQKGVATLAAGTITISSVGITSTSRIFVSQKTPGNTALTTEYAALGADRTTGAGTGSFKITALLANGTINTADTSTLDWRIEN